MSSTDTDNLMFAIQFLIKYFNIDVQWVLIAK